MRKYTDLRRTTAITSALISAAFVATAPAMVRAADRTLSGATTSTVDLGAGDSLTVTTTGSITGTNPAVDITAAGATFITNAGTITGTTNAITITGVAGLTGAITNTGSITGTAGDGIQIVVGGSVLGGIDNSGTIAAGGDGIALDSTGTVAGGIVNSGTITAGSDGIRVDDSSDVTGGIVNSGTITAGDDGIRVDDRSDITGGIVNSGTIVAGSNGIFLSDSSTVTGGISNSGTITAGSDGIFVSASSTVTGGISNSGTIIAGDTGIFVDTTVTITGAIINSGTIIAGDNGIKVDTDSVVTEGILNSGTITAVGHGILLETLPVFAGSVINSGIITAGSDGIRVDTLSVVSGGIVNGGTIFAGDVGIKVTDFSTVSGGINNSGTINGSTGIFIETGSTVSSVTNSGTIIGRGGTAIDFDGNDDSRLVLNPGSRIQGVIAFGGGVRNQVVIGDGPNSNAVYSYTGSLASLEVQGGAVALRNSDTIAVISHSGFDAVKETSVNTSINIGRVLSSRLITARLNDSSPSKVQLAASSSTMNDADASWKWGFKEKKPSFWIEGFGAYQERSSHKSVEANVTRTAGAVSGIDLPLDGNKRAGFFVGGLGGTTRIGNTVTTHEIDATGGFGGGYYSLDRGAYFVDLTLTAGFIENESDRRVFATGGEEIARASFDNLFITPSVTVGTELNFIPVIVSGTLRYTGQWVDGYTETGLTAANLTVDDRFLSTVSSRVQIETASRGGSVGKGTLRVNGRAGLEGNVNVNDENVTVTALGQSVSFDTDGRDYNLDAFLGINVTYDFKGSAKIYVDAEGNAGLDDKMAENLGGLARAGVKVSF